jgi:photosystem II stability/assembly factor-like uncharacterized protein
MRIPTLLFILLAATAAAQDWRPLYATGFDEGFTEGWFWYTNMPDRWNWAAEQDEGNWVLSGTVISGRNPAAYNAASWNDFRVKARVKILSGSMTVNFRSSRCAGYWLRLWTASSPQGPWWKQLDCGMPQQMGQYAGTVQAGRWYTVEVEGRGARLRAWLDGKPLLDFTDPDPIPAGSVAFEASQNSHIHVDDVEVSGPPDTPALSWVRTGGPLGGTGYDIRMRPDNPDILYVTDVFSGVSISTDGGLTWSTSNTGIVSRGGFSGDAVPIFCLTIDPNNYDILWAGTQNTRGIYRSTNGGKTWQQRDNGVVEGEGITFRGFAVDPRNSNVVYAAAQVSSTVWAGRSIMSFPFDHSMGVVYRTTDAGLNWTAIWRGDSLARYVWLDPRNPDTIYISTGFWDVMAANTDDDRSFAGGVGIVKSTDGGATWRVLNENNGLAGLYVGSLFMHPTNPDILLAGVGNNRYPQNSGAYLTTDGGETWTRTLATHQDITAVEIVASDPSIAFASSHDSFYRSADGGRTWKKMAGAGMNGAFGWAPAGLRSGVPSDLEVDPRNPDRVFLNSYVGGNFLTEDGGRTWANASRGYTGAVLSNVAVDPSDHRRVYAIGRSGPFRSDDGGRTWIGLQYVPTNYAEWLPGYGLPPEWSSVAVDPSRPERVLISDEMTGLLFLGPDHGLNWKIVGHYPKAGLQGVSSNHGFKALAFAPSDPSVVYAGLCADCRQRQEPVDKSGGIWKSTDGGETWREANDASTAELNIHVLAVDPRSPDIAYAGTGGQGILRTLDGGLSWKPCNKGLKTLDVRSIAVDPTDFMVIYAGAFEGGLYKSTDACDSWAPASLGLEPTAPILDLAIDPTAPQVLYAADSRMGVYRSEDGGHFWSLLGTGLTTRAVRGLALSSDGGTLYAATDGEGIFRMDLKPFERGNP